MAFRAYKYTQGQKAILSVLACIALITTATLTAIRFDIIGIHTSPDSYDARLDSTFRAEVTAFEQQIHHYDSIRRINRDTLAARPQKPRLFRFDPNSIDSAAMVSLGFKPHVARNLARYRKKGGVIRSASDLKRIYGIDTTLVGRLSPYIIIDSVAAGIVTAQHDTAQAAMEQYKRKEYARFDLNRADSALLVTLPGIGPARAAAIQAYRKQLGGYASPQQLDEVEILPDSVVAALVPYATADTALIRRIPVNRISIKQLRRHPYINYYQARAIYDLRWDNAHQGTLAPHDLESIGEFTPEELRRLLPYLDFSE